MKERTVGTALSLLFALTMLAAVALSAGGLALIPLGVSAAAVLVGQWECRAAVLAVVACAAALALSNPDAASAAMAGLAATAYLVLRHATLTPPTALGAVGFTTVAVAAATVGSFAWIPLLAPVLVIALFALVVHSVTRTPS